MSLAKEVWTEIKRAAAEAPAMYFAPFVGAFSAMAKIASSGSHPRVRASFELDEPSRQTMRHAIVTSRSAAAQKMRFAARKKTVRSLR